MPSPRIPAFHTVQTRSRKDGWTPLRQAEFIGHLAETRCVRSAALAVGMRRETAYRLRARAGAESFCAAWDSALLKPDQFADALALHDRAAAARRATRKVTLWELEWRSETGIWQVMLRRGRYVGVRQKADNCALLALVSRIGKLSERWDYEGWA